MANVDYDTPGGHDSVRCCRCCPSDLPQACNSLLPRLCGCELSWRDILRLLPCVAWVIVGILSSVVHIVRALCADKFPETVPLFLGWLSALPAFMSAVLIVMYHRDALNEKGFTKDTAINFGLLYGFLMILGCLIYLTFLIASFVFMFECTPELPVVHQSLEHCKRGNFGYNFFCITMALLWVVIQNYLTPCPRFVQELILKHEHAHAGVNLAAVGRPRPSQASTVAGDAGAPAASQANSVQPTIYGNPVMYETATVYTGQPTPFTGAATYARTVSPADGGAAVPQK